MPATVARHRRPVEWIWRPTRETLRRAARSRTALATSALTCLALATLAGQAGVTDPTTAAVDASVASQPGVVGGAADTVGALDRRSAGAKDGDGAGPLDSVMTAERAAQDEQAAEAAAAEAAAAEAARLVANPPPVAGLDQIQMNNAMKIVQAGQAMGLPARAYVIAVATSMQESNLRNLASTRIPESYQYNAEGEGSDHDSVGLFQQRASSGWGAVPQLMDPTYSATAFYSALVRVPGWEGMELTWAAQRVQVSAFPYAYAKHETRAHDVVFALLTVLVAAQAP